MASLQARGQPRKDLARRLRELQLINDSLRALTSTLDLAVILRGVLDRIKMLSSAEALSLLLYDQERDELVFAATEMLQVNSMVGPRPPRPRGVGREPCTNELIVPLRRDGLVIGALECCGPPDGGASTAAERRRARALAAQIEVDLDPQAAPHDAETIRQILARVMAALPHHSAGLLLYDPHGNELAFRASGTARPGVIDGVRLQMGQGIAGWVASHREAVRLDDASNDPRHDPELAERTGLRPRTMLCVPVINKDALLGIIQVINKMDGSPFDDDELRLVQALAEHAAIAIENAILYRQAHLASITDDLTGLSNTRHFNRLLPALLAQDGPLSLLVLDLDELKPIVDRYGHLAGSRTIAHVGHLIAERLGPADLAARFGGDEFVVILPGVSTAAARETAELIRAAVEACTSPDGLDIDIGRLTASVGVATFPEHGGNADELFRAADAAMYSVKRARKNGVQIAAHD
jgi:diguanylate cyclase (GGDEF)-like protein